MRMRVDAVSGETGKAWALGMYVPWVSPRVNHALVLGYRLCPGAKKYVEGATHELALHGLDPSVAIDFTTSLFKQKELRPLMPCWVGYQFLDLTDAQFVGKLVQVARAIRHHQFSPREQKSWDTMFSDAFPLHDSSPWALEPEQELAYA